MSLIEVANRIIASTYASNIGHTRDLINAHGLDLNEVDVTCETRCAHCVVHTLQGLRQHGRGVSGNIDVGLVAAWI